VVRALELEFRISERRACHVIDQPRSSQRYRAKPREDEVPLVKRMRELTGRRPRFGYRRIGALLRREGWSASNTRMLRLWRREGLKVPQKRRRKRHRGTSASACHVQRAERPNQVWCWDFVFDRTTAGSPLKWLSIIDEYTRECLALKVDRHITAEDVIDTLAELLAMHGAPAAIRSDNGPEFVAEAIQRWLKQIGVQTLYIAPGHPWENGYAESFHGRLRDEFLSTEEFETLMAARAMSKMWRTDYNEVRPHSSLGYQTPTEFASRCGVGLRATPSGQPHTACSLTPAFITPGTEI